MKPSSMQALIPVRTVSEANARGHLAQKAWRAKRQRGAALLVMRSAGAPPALPLRVLLTRVAPSSGLDSDNLCTALKAVRDGIADWLGVDDRDIGVEWSYAQERGPWCVRVEVSEGAYP